MSLADELLNSLVEVESEEDNKTLVIDNYLRIIQIPDGVENLGVEYDDEVLRLQFKMPRYIGDIDLSKFTVRINYVNARQEGDIYEVDDLKIEDDHLAFSWLVGPNATAYKGKTRFNVCLKIVDKDGVIDKEYNTTPASLPVLEGLETDVNAIEPHSDILEQWKTQLFGIGDTEEAKMRAVSKAQQAEIKAKGAATLATIPGDYTEVYQMAYEATRLKAEGIIRSGEGEQIFLDDSSSSYLIGMNLYGRTLQEKTNGYNLFDTSVFGNKITGGAAVTNNMDGSIRVSSFSEDTSLSADFSAYHYYTHEETTALLKPGKLTFKTNVDTYPRVHVYLQRDAVENLMLSSNGPYEVDITQESLDDITFKMVLGVYGEAGGDIVPGTVWPMLYQDGDGTWEPFSNGLSAPNPDHPKEFGNILNPEVRMFGKNLLQGSPGASPSNGITYTSNPDGSILINGTSTGESFFAIDFENSIPVYDAELVASIEGSDGNVSLAVSYFRSDDTSIDLVSCTTEERRFKYPSEAVSTRTCLVIEAGKTFNNLLVYPMIRLPETSKSFEPSIVPIADNPRGLVCERALRGLPVNQNGNYTDSNGQQWICDEVDFERGKFIRRTNAVPLSSFPNWSRFVSGASVNQFYALCNECRVDDNECNVMSPHLFPIRVSDRSARFNTVYTANQSGNSYICVNMEPTMTESEWTALIAKNDIRVLYILDTPIETDLTTSELLAFKKLCTNATNTTILNEQNCWMSVKYVADIKSLAAKKSDITLSANKWIESANGQYYSQTVEYNAKSNSKIDLHLTPLQRIGLISSSITIFLSNEHGVVTAYSIGGVPSADLAVGVIEQAVYG